MTVGSVTSAAAQNVQAQKTLSGNFDTFLRLLTAQLQNQDPLEPLDATKFTEQLVSYSQVEQQINTNANLTALLALSKSAAGANAVTYLGKNAYTSGAVSSLDQGSAGWRYTLPADAASVMLTVTDATGRIVRTLPGETGVGAHVFHWDGMNAAGTAMPAGSYSLSVTAKSAADELLPAGVSGLGSVKEIDLSGAEPVLTIGARKVGLSDILSLSN